MSDSQITADSLLTSYQVGSFLQVNPSSVNKWVSDGRMPAFRTPGGHRRIRAGDLVSFLETHNMPVPKVLENAGKRRVLLVDSNATALLQLSQTLTHHNERVAIESADNSMDAMMHIGAFKPHLLVLNLSAGELKAFDLIKRLRANKETENIQILGLATSTDHDSLQRAEKASIPCMSNPPPRDAFFRAVGV
jgi:excisionase family DNA binding protein